ncbi:MAG: Ig-like domain-containing protein [Bacteroidota bacterium]
MKKVFSLGLLIAAMTLIAFPSCKKDKKVTGVKLSETTKSIVVGSEFVLTVTVAPANATNKEVTWTSDKAYIATVDNNGKVKGVKEGEATITVTTKDDNKTTRCKVTVVDAEAEKTALFVTYIIPKMKSRTHIHM